MKQVEPNKALFVLTGLTKLKTTVSGNGYHNSG